MLVFSEIDRYSEEAYRVIAVAYQPFAQAPFRGSPEEATPEILETNLTFVGLFGIIDPPRDSVKPSIQKAYDAGSHFFPIPSLCLC